MDQYECYRSVCFFPFWFCPTIKTYFQFILQIKGFIYKHTVQITATVCFYLGPAYLNGDRSNCCRKFVL